MLTLDKMAGKLIDLEHSAHDLVKKGYKNRRNGIGGLHLAHERV